MPQLPLPRKSSLPSALLRGSSPRPRPWASLVPSALLLLLAGGCGGSSSETPFPQSAHEVSAIPVLQRPQRAKPRAPVAPTTAPTAAPPDPDDDR